MTERTTPEFLVVGDIIVDRYNDCLFERICPEAPVPILFQRRSVFQLGAAANVALNLKALGCRVRLIGMVGTDWEGDWAIKELVQHGFQLGVTRSRHRRTTLKTRFQVEDHILFRLDREEYPGATDSEESAELASLIDRMSEGVTGVLVSDYGKGVVTNDVQAAVMRAEARGLPIFLDPHPSTEYFEGLSARFLCPNTAELKALKRVPLHHALVETRGGHGLRVKWDEQNGEKHDDHFSSVASFAKCVVGAGDVVLASLAYAWCGDSSPTEAARFANDMAGRCVERSGNCCIDPRWLKDVKS